MNVLALCNDLIFRTKIESTAKSLGCAIARSAADVGEDESAIVLVDLDSAWPEPAQAVLGVLSRKRRVRVVAFGSHVRADLFAEAREAGIRDVMARSAFVNKLPALLAESSAEA